MTDSGHLSAIVVGMHLRWNGVWQRPHHILSRIAAHVPVFVVEEPLAAPCDGHALERYGNVQVIRPLRVHASYADPMDSLLLEQIAAIVGGGEVGVLLYSPAMLALASAFPGAPLMYDCMDELAAFAGAPPRIVERENELLARAALVFFGGPSLFRAKRDRTAHALLFASGVDAAFFGTARTTPMHPLMRLIPKPRILYVGVIDERIDYALIQALAGASMNVVMAGPIAKIDPAILPYHSNVHYTGQLPYAALPSLLAGTEVAIMPFAHNASTVHISPTKTLEYLAAGVPVVSTAIRDVIDLYGEYVTLADGAEEFVEACRRAPDSDPMKRERGSACARTMNWDSIADNMWAQILALSQRR